MNADEILRFFGRIAGKFSFAFRFILNSYSGLFFMSANVMSGEVGECSLLLLRECPERENQQY